jgi:hypothetical protein
LKSKNLLRDGLKRSSIGGMKVAACLALAFFLQQSDADKSQRPPFSITIRAVPSSVIQAGQRFSIEILLTNLSDRPMDVPSVWFNGDPSFDATYRFDVRDSTGKQIPWVPPASVTGFFASQSGTLEPGKSSTRVEDIQDFFDFRKPGSYVVEAMRRAAFKNPSPCGLADLDENGNVILCDPGRVALPTADLTKADILSNKITITVVPAKQEGLQ